MFYRISEAPWDKCVLIFGYINKTEIEIKNRDWTKLCVDSVFAAVKDKNSVIWGLKRV